MTFQRRWKKRGAHLLDAPPSCRCPKIVPWYALVLDVDWFARAQGESGRTANRVANLVGCRVRPDVNRRCGWRDGCAARLGARHFDAHWGEDVEGQERHQLVDEAELRLDPRRAVRALRGRRDRARWHEPENPACGKRLFDDLSRGFEAGIDGGVVA